MTYDDFAAYGIRRSSVAAAIREAESLGWITVTDRGRGGNADFRKASLYALAWLPTADGQLVVNQWRRFRSIEHAAAAKNDAKPLQKANRLAA